MRPADSPPNDEPDHRRLWSTGAALDDWLHSVVDTTGSTAVQPTDPVDGRGIHVCRPSRGGHHQWLHHHNRRIRNRGYRIPRRSPDNPPPPQGHLRGLPSLAGYPRPRIPEQDPRLHLPVRTGRAPPRGQQSPARWPALAAHPPNPFLGPNCRQVYTTNVHRYRQQRGTTIEHHKIAFYDKTR